MSDWGAIQRVSAEVVLAGGDVLEGDLHLAALLTYPAATESPLEMLNRSDPFFALSPDPARASAARMVEIEVSLANGAEYRGRATYELPAARARTLDYVNGSERFFTAWTDHLARYINKSLVRIIRPLD